MSFDEDILMGQLGAIEVTLEEIKSGIDDVDRHLPDTTDNSEVERKLDTIINLLNKILNKL